MRPLVTMIVLGVAVGCSGAAASGPMAGDAPGCTDRTAAEKLAALDDTDPDFIGIWAKGMQDGTCRGFSAGLDVTVDERDDALACVRAAEDASCYWVRAEAAPR